MDLRTRRENLSIWLKGELVARRLEGRDALMIPAVLEWLRSDHTDLEPFENWAHEFFRYPLPSGQAKYGRRRDLYADLDLESTAYASQDRS